MAVIKSEDTTTNQKSVSPAEGTLETACDCGKMYGVGVKQLFGGGKGSDKKLKKIKICCGRRWLQNDVYKKHNNQPKTSGVNIWEMGCDEGTRGASWAGGET